MKTTFDFRKKLPQAIVAIGICIILTLIPFFYCSNYISNSDANVYYLVAKSMYEGQTLYKDIWENKPPMIHWIYLVGMKIFGVRYLLHDLLWLIFIFFTNLTIFFIFDFFKNKFVTVLTGIFFSALLLDQFLDTREFNCEHPANLFIALATLLLIRIFADQKFTFSKSFLETESFLTIRFEKYRND
ncbi:MAG: hypothetical protein Kow0029_16530 [Candidatus Rifleibacteriota bacterium]